MSLNQEAMVNLLKTSAQEGATEIHFKVPSRPLLRVNGSLTPTTLPAITPRDVQEAVYALCSLAQHELALANVTDESFSFGLRGVGRFRAYIYRQRGSLSAVVQRVNTQSPALYELGIETGIERSLGEPGLMMLCGDRRHELLGALVSDYNARIRGHAVIIESPLNYLYRDAVATIAQREVGTDVPDYPTAIRQATRIGVDLLVIGEVEDTATADALLTAVEHGVSAVACVAAPVAEEAPWWLERMFAGESRSDTSLRLERRVRSIVCVSTNQPVQIINGVPQMRAAG
jgi:twitching motility protein PilT